MAVQVVSFRTGVAVGVVGRASEAGDMALSAVVGVLHVVAGRAFRAIKWFVHAFGALDAARLTAARSLILAVWTGAVGRAEVGQQKDQKRSSFHLLCSYS